MKILLIDSSTKVLTCKNKTVPLTNKEFLLFEYILSQRINKSIPVNKVISHVWKGREKTIGRLNVSQLIYRVRRKLESLDNSAEIKFSMSTGIRFNFMVKCVVLQNNIFSRLLNAFISW